MRTIGLIGGMSWQSSRLYYDRINQMVAERLGGAHSAQIILNSLDFASPVSGLGSKMGLDATHKWPGETQREWGRPIVQDAAVSQRMAALWDKLGF